MPDVLVAAWTMHSGMDILKPLLSNDAFQEKGTVIIGTVKGDLHDTGKHLGMMIKGAGSKVVDLGTKCRWKNSFRRWKSIGGRW